MSETLLILGFIILLIAIHDFFYTTLSASGAGFVSKNVAILSDRILQFFVRTFGRKVYNYHGLFINLMILVVWLFLIWLGLFLVYSSNPEAITNSSGRVANYWERLYFTGYTLSTLGMGNFKPTSPFFELVTSCFSFFGFIFFTSSMTYFLSVSSAVVKKRTLAKSIYNLGHNPQAIVKKILALDSSYSFQQILELQEKVDGHSVSHQAYPVVHFYSRSEVKDSFSINIARLDEALTFLLKSKKGENLREELEILRSSLSNFLQNLDKNFSRSLPKAEASRSSEDLPHSLTERNSQELIERRRILEGLLKSEGLSWRQVVEQDQKN
ncbi:ion channel [Zunongwangia sp. F260]|uniref:Ion channel n=1 Tax=Autumnicola lenta TaxID=3075593 RepID=A0ABU3CJC4_9FLAO|nr:ion channel [Zunongwangia sp. F260]MDT0646458.1 ion channel [Zunongwangia sp. F260]